MLIDKGNDMKNVFTLIGISDRGIGLATGLVCALMVYVVLLKGGFC